MIDARRKPRARRLTRKQPPARRRDAAGRHAWIRRLLPYLRPRPGNMLLAFGAAVVSGLVGAGLLLIQRQVLDLAVDGRTDLMAVPLALLVGACAVAYFIARVGAYRELKAANDAQFLVYQAVHRRMLEIDADGHALPAGQLAARLNTDIDALSRVVALLPRLAATTLTTLATAALMLRLSPVLAASTLVVAPLLVLVSRRARGKIQPATWTAQQREADVAQAASEAIAGVRVVKALGQESREIARMAEQSTRLYAARLRLVRLQAFYQPLMGSLSSVVQLIVFVAGGWMMLRGHMSLGTFLAFSSYSGQLVSTVRWFADTVVEVQEAGVSARRVLDLIDLPPAIVEHPDARPLPEARGEVRVDQIRYAYAGGAPVLDDVSLRVAAGETVAIVGPSGCGKSTLVKLLARCHDPDRGAIFLDGFDARRVTVASLRRQIGVVFDDPMLFTGAIRDVIAFGRPDADDAEVIAAARLAGAHDFVDALPEGYQTQVGERGYTLSGGQRQRIALARALLVEPRLLILDDATGGVDAELEREIYRRLRSRGRTTIVVGYRASAVAGADRVLLMDAGRIVDEGRHEELLERSEPYRRLIEPERPYEAVEDKLREVSAGSASADAANPVAASADADRPGTGVLPARSGPADPRPAAHPGDQKRFSPARLLWPHRAALGAVLLLSIAQTGIGVLNPYVTRIAVDDGVLAGSTRGLVQAAVAIIVMTLVGMVIAPVTMRVAGKVGQRVIVDLRQRVWSHMVRLPIGYYESQKAGRLLTRVINDVEAFAEFATGGLAAAIVSALTAIGILIAMLVVNPVLGAAVGVSVIPFTLALRFINRKIAVAYLAARDQVGEANAVLQENLAGARETQVFAQQERRHQMYQRLVRRYLDHRLVAENLIARSTPLLMLAGSLVAAAVLGAGALMLSRGQLTAGSLIAFVLWCNAFYAPITMLGQFFTEVQRVHVSTARIRMLMAVSPGPPAPLTPAAPAAPRGELTLRGVRFTYPGTSTEVLRGVDLTAPAGATLALIGVTGIGKSTIFKLLARFYDPSAGEVRLDGVDLRDLDPAAFRRHLAYLPQEPFLFTGTVRDNIAYARPDAGDDEVRAAAVAVGAHDGIMALPGGYRHPVGDRGGALPAGLRQLVCLARAHLTDPAVVLLDEATAKLDLATEMRVLRAIRAVARGRTTLMIAHRLQTAMLADHIAVLAGGRVVEQGDHEGLLAADGIYAALFRASALALDPIAQVLEPALDPA